MQVNISSAPHGHCGHHAWQAQVQFMVHFTPPPAQNHTRCSCSRMTRRSRPAPSSPQLPQHVAPHVCPHIVVGLVRRPCHQDCQQGGTQLLRALHPKAIGWAPVLCCPSPTGWTDRTPFWFNQWRSPRGTAPPIPQRCTRASTAVCCQGRLLGLHRL